ncbi:hypothetical protein BKA69DRAFT_943746 [Paraphysoderma sedebokerense]|nr:hypothetical protein BKA69DRAFT_943746 [Paraphysoderma sedebokerense]
MMLLTVLLLIDDIFQDPSEEMNATTSARSGSSKSSKVEASTQEPKSHGKTQRASSHSSTQVEEITTLPNREQPDIRVKPGATDSKATEAKKEPKQTAEKTRKGKGKKEVEEPSKVIGFKPNSGTEQSRIPRFRVEDAETETDQFYTPSTESPLREQLTTLPEVPPSGVQMPVAEIVPPHEIEEVSKQMEALSIESGRKAARHTPIIPEQLPEHESQDKSQVRSTLETVTSMVKDGQVPSNESVTSSINTIQSSGIFENLTTKDSGISSTGEVVFLLLSTCFISTDNEWLRL